MGPEAFEYYVALGAERSYAKVAAHFGMTKRGVTKRAVDEQWSTRLLEVENDVVRRVEESCVDTVASMRVRHIAAARKLLDKALTALMEMKVESPRDAVRMAEAAVRIERITRDTVLHRVAIQVRRELVDTDFTEIHHSGARQQERDAHRDDS
jgi:hypothetical protein